MKRLFFAGLSLAVRALAADASADRSQIPWANVITAAELRGSVSFLASDSLEGRNTPSPGLETAADFIISRFRSFGLASPPGADFSQTAAFTRVSDHGQNAQFTLAGAAAPTRGVTGSEISVRSFQGLALVSEPVFKWAPNVKITGSLAGKILMLRAPSDPATSAKLEFAHPDAIVELIRKPPGPRNGELVPESQVYAGKTAIVQVPAANFESAFDRLPLGLTAARASLRFSAPLLEPVRLRNVIGLLPGSDAALRSQYVLISAHYDHLGLAAQGNDRVFNGANDNASGVAAVLALAQAFGARPAHPRRTLVFVCFFGEEEGLLGSAWYVQHPVVPLSQTVTDINFEQLGIPGPEDGLPAGSLGVTGFAYSNFPEMLAPEIEAAGVRVRDARHNEDFFARSDNYPFAKAGIPSHTLVAAFEFPDYHRVSDEWPKLDYENEARIVRALAGAIDQLADSTGQPRWSESARTKGFIAAWRALHD